MRSYILLLLVIGNVMVAPALFNASSSYGNTKVNTIRNFQKATYQAAKQNWSVDRSPNGFMYFANHGGLLEFDGITWKLHPLPNETILRSVLAASDSLIYTSGYRELGYWETDETGELKYYSLNELAEQYFSDNEEFWNIALLDDAVYFHSFNRVLIYRNKQIIPLELPGFTNTMHRVGDAILLAVRNRGIYKVENNQAVPFIQSPLFENIMIRFILPYQDDQLMIGTNSNGIFIWDGNSISQWNQEWDDYFRKNEVNRGYIDDRGHLIIGTIMDGIVVFDEQGNKIASYNTSSGLQNNTVLGISTDQFYNTWLALDSGIDFISNDSNYGFMIETIPNIGAVYDAAVFEDQIYLGTNQGLFTRNIYDDQSGYKLVPESQDQVWDIHIYDGHLFAGHNDGVIQLKDGQQQFISRQSGGFSIRQDPMKAGYLLASTYSSIIRLKQEGGSYIQDGVVKGFYDLIRYIEIDHLGDIWASHMRRGIYRLQLNDKRDSVISRTYYGLNSVFKKDHSLHVFKVENRIVFTTEQTLYTYDDLNDSIIPYHFLNQQLEDIAAANRIIAAPDHHYWFITGEKIGLFRIFNNTVEPVKTYPRSIFSGNELIDDFENILPLTATKAIVCLENGIAQLDAEITDTISVISKLQPKLRALELNNSRHQTTSRPINKQDIHIQYKYHNIQLQYSFPLFTHNPIYFQYFLKGLDQDWTERTAAPRFSFDRLPAGEYELLVKAVDQWGNESQVHSLLIEVAPPWYLSNYARTAYFIGFIAILFGFRSWGIQQTRKKERLEHEKRERELIRLRNEKLRDEVQHKSKELANSTMSIVKKNELLLEIREIAARQKEQLGSRYPDKYYYHLTRKIEENITSQDDWQLFETNFERAHERFLNKIREMYPELTARDLRLCAFLRMNLSSKEIAPLLGISVRGVENHRYRLRKKMSLDHDQKLIDLILGL
jgi:DNA-binding CsgD family transcriptional regulator